MSTRRQSGFPEINSSSKHKVLISIPSQPESLEYSRILSEAGIETKACTDQLELINEIKGGAAAAIISGSSLRETDLDEFKTVLSEQPVWSDFPLLVLVSREDDFNQCLYKLEGLEEITQLLLLKYPISPATLLSGIRSLLKSRFRQYQIRDELKQRKIIENELTELNDTLESRVFERTKLAEQRASDLRRLAAELTRAEQRERRRLAQILHDDLQQLLVATKLSLRQLNEKSPNQLKPEIEKIDTSIDLCLKTSRNLNREISPPILQHGSLMEIMDWLSEWYEEKHALEIEIFQQGDSTDIPEHYQEFLYQAVRELLLNVVKHSGADHAKVTVIFGNSDLTVKVEDGGRGFDPEVVTAQLHRPKGFGLFHISERLEALQGQLVIEKTPQGGARFQLLLPLKEHSYSLSRVEPIPQPKKLIREQGEAVRVLIVEDHAVVREAISDLIMKQPEFEVVGEAADGEQAIRQADILRPDIILMDLEMPKMGGLEATRQIKARQPDIVVVVLSIHDDMSIKRTIEAAGASTLVSKHIAAKELIKILRQHT